MNFEIRSGKHLGWHKELTSLCFVFCDLHYVFEFQREDLIRRMIQILSTGHF